jgi:cation transport regulator ChaC
MEHGRIARGQDARWYFAYGSNMQAATLRGRRGIEPLDVRVGRLPGYRLCFDIPIGAGARGVANLAIDVEAHVWGVAYLLTGDQHERLDRTEGVPAGVYRRLPVHVATPAGSLAAETYISERRDPSRLPSFRYLGLLREGAREHALPADWLSVLEAWTLAWDERDGAHNPAGLLPPLAR